VKILAAEFSLLTNSRKIC